MANKFKEIILAPVTTALKTQGGVGMAVFVLFSIVGGVSTFFGNLDFFSKFIGWVAPNPLGFIFLLLCTWLCCWLGYNELKNREKHTQERLDKILRQVERYQELSEKSTSLLKCHEVETSLRFIETKLSANNISSMSSLAVSSPIECFNNHFYYEQNLEHPTVNDYIGVSCPEDIPQEHRNRYKQISYEIGIVREVLQRKEATLQSEVHNLRL